MNQTLLEPGQLQQLAAATPVRNFLKRYNIVRSPGLNLFDSASLQAGRESHWDAVSAAADADREKYKQLLRGLANSSGMRRGRQFEKAIDDGSRQISRLAPYMMTVAPNLWDQLHGNRGSAASLASAVAQSHPERSPLENAAAAQSIFKKLPADGLAARDVGVVYKTMVDRGLMGQKGGIEADEASKRLLHVGIGIRGLIDANREYPVKSAFVTMPRLLRNWLTRRTSPSPYWPATSTADRDQPTVTQPLPETGPTMPPSPFVDPPEKPQLLLRLQNAHTAEAARAEFDRNGGVAALFAGLPRV